MNWDTAQQLVRKGIGYGAGFLVSWGVIDATIAPTVIGIGMGVVDFAWWAYWNKIRRA